MTVRRRAGALGFWRTLVVATVLLEYCAGAGLAHTPHLVRPGETLGSIAKEHLGSTARWREIAAANGLTNPHQIPPGLILRIPSLDAPDVATDVTGSGEFRENDQAPWRPIAPNTAIPRSGEIRTDTVGLVTVRTSEGVQLRIRGRSVLRLAPADGGLRRATLMRGGVAAKVARASGGTFQISTPVAVAGVRGTDFLVDYDADAERSSVSVREGLVNHTAQDVTVGVAAGYGSFALAGAPPSSAIPLPAPPELAAPAAGAAITDPVVNFRWRAATGAAAYLLEIGRDPEFTRLVAARVVPSPAADSFVSARVDRLPAGTLYWRVATRDANALEGIPTSARRLALADPLATLRRLYGERRFDEVIVLVDQIDSPAFRHSMLRAWAYYRLSLIDQAESAFRNLSAGYPENNEVVLGLAYCAFRAERNDEAEQRFRDVLRTEPDSAEALLGIAHIRYRQERWAEAVDYYERCLRFSPGNSEAEEYLREARMKAGPY
jgi:hypothetical protein